MLQQQLITHTEHLLVRDHQCARSLARGHNTAEKVQKTELHSQMPPSPPLLQTPACTVVVAGDTSNLEAVVALERLVFGEEPWAGERAESALRAPAPPLPAPFGAPVASPRDLRQIKRSHHTDHY